MSKTIFVNVNEEDVAYAVQDTLPEALEVLGKHPNDIIIIAYDDSPYGVHLLKEVKKYWPEEDGPRNDDWIHEAYDAKARADFATQQPDTGISMVGR